MTIYGVFHNEYMKFVADTREKANEWVKEKTGLDGPDFEEEDRAHWSFYVVKPVKVS